MLEEVTNVTFDECVKRNFVNGEDEISITRMQPVVLDSELLFGLRVALLRKKL